MAGVDAKYTDPKVSIKKELEKMRMSPEDQKKLADHLRDTYPMCVATMRLCDNCKGVVAMFSKQRAKEHGGVPPMSSMESWGDLICETCRSIPIVKNAIQYPYCWTDIHKL